MTVKSHKELISHIGPSWCADSYLLGIHTPAHYTNPLAPTKGLRVIIYIHSVVWKPDNYEVKAKDRSLQ